MATEDLPDWLPTWCLDHLGGKPADVLFQLESISTVFGLRLTDGTEVVVKSRPDDGRAGSCVEAQARLAERGFPCARPITPVVGAGSLAVHAEEFRPGGDMLRGDSPDVAVRYAEVFARLMVELADVEVALPLPNPRWARWDHTDPGLWPSIDFLDERDQSAVPAYVVDTAVRSRSGYWPRICRACWATRTSKRRTSGGTASGSGWCTTGTAWRGNRRRRWRERPAPRSPMPGRPCCRRSKGPKRSSPPTRNSGGARSPTWSWRSRGRPACGAAHHARWEALHGTRPCPRHTAGTGRRTPPPSERLTPASAHPPLLHNRPKRLFETSRYVHYSEPTRVGSGARMGSLGGHRRRDSQWHESAPTCQDACVDIARVVETSWAQSVLHFEPRRRA